MLDLPYSINKNNVSISIYSNGIKFDGEFYYVYNREIIRAKPEEDFIDFKDYMGSNCLKIRSEKKLSQAVLPYFVISIVKSIMNIISNAKEVVIGQFSEAADMIEYAERFNKAKEIIGDTTGSKMTEFFNDKIMGFISGFLPFPIPPSGINIVLWILQLVAIILFIRYYFSKKNVYEFSATNKRIAIDMDKLSRDEYMNLLYLIDEAKRVKKEQ